MARLTNNIFIPAPQPSRVAAYRRVETEEIVTSRPAERSAAPVSMEGSAAPVSTDPAPEADPVTETALLSEADLLTLAEEAIDPGHLLFLLQTGDRGLLDAFKGNPQYMSARIKEISSTIDALQNAISGAFDNKRRMIQRLAQQIRLPG